MWRMSGSDCLKAKYPERWTGSGGSIVWPTRTPNIIPMDFIFLLVVDAGRSTFMQTVSNIEGLDARV